MNGLTGNCDVERIVVRDRLLALEGERFSAAVLECVKRHPIAELAGYIEGDREGGSFMAVGPREAILERVRARFPNGEVDHIAAMVRIHEPDYLPCAFVVTLADGSIDVSVMGLNIPAEAMDASAKAHPPGPGATAVAAPKTDPKRDAAIAAYVRERDAVLLDPDLNRLRRHLAKYGRPEALEASDEVMRTAWHKGRTAVKSLPRAERRKSIKWLEKRGFMHFSDDGAEEPS